MEKETPTIPKLGDVSKEKGVASLVPQVESMREILQRRTGLLMNQPTGEGTLSLKQQAAQGHEFLRTAESLHSPWGIPPLPEKPSPWEDAKAFLASFEQVAEACWWPREEWVIRLLPALSGEAAKAFNGLDVQDREDYGKVKAAILRRDALNREKQRQQFRRFCYQEAEGPRGAYRRLWEMCRGWLRVEKHSKEQILELLILEQLLNVLPPEIESWVRANGPESCSQAVALAEEFLLSPEDQVPLEEEGAGWVSEAGEAPSENEQKHPFLVIKEEEDGETSLLVGIVGETAGELQRSSSENSVEEDSEGNLRDPSGIRREERNDTDEKRDKKPFPCQGGGFREIPTQDERPAKRRRKEALRSNQRIYFKVKENRRVTRGDDQRNEEDEEPNELSSVKAKNKELKGSLKNLERAKGQDGSCLAEKRGQPYLGLGGDFCDVNQMGEETYKCLECGMDFSDQAQYNTHLQTHSGKTPEYMECGKSFSCRSELSRHPKIPTAEKANSCPPCGKSFSYKTNLIHHKRIHSTENPFISPGSGKSSSDGKKDNAHFPKHSVITASKFIQRGKYFRYKSQFLEPQKTHTEEKPLECSECGQKFNKRFNFQRHLRTHTGEKPFECSECGQKFSQSFNFQRHQRIHMRSDSIAARPLTRTPFISHTLTATVQSMQNP